MMPTSTMSRQLLVALAAAAAMAACSKSGSNDQASAGSLDTAVLATNGAVGAEGPGIHVTRTDGKSVTRALRYELTADNFAHFLAAADSLMALQQRDSAARAYLANNITDGSSNVADAGRKWLEANAPVSSAIVSAGISIQDYFVQGIAIAAAERFMNDPKAAPPTPTLERNAEFLQSRKADLDRLAAQREGKTVVKVTP